MTIKRICVGDVVRVQEYEHVFIVHGVEFAGDGYITLQSDTGADFTGKYEHFTVIQEATENSLEALKIVAQTL